MKPLKLEMGAFGPYAVQQSIDFGELKNKSIFLIHGPTGSGKTTILDGICFALYGDTSGAERNARNMRSHHADLSQITEVVFEFELKHERYRVSRKPEQERMKKSGTGTTIQSPEAVLWKLEDEEQKAVLVETGWKNVTDAIERMIGFKSDQFRQVIMLPQGKFRKLLVADSIERQQILEKLFHTEFYRGIEELLKKSAKELKDQIKEKQNQRDWYLKKVACENMEALQQLIRVNEEKRVQLQGLLEEKFSAVKNAQEKFRIGKEGNEKIKEKEQVEKDLKKAQEDIPKIELKRVELQKARKAATLEETEKITRLRSQDREQCQKDLIQTKKNLEESEKHHKKAKERLQIENDQEEIREKARNKVLEIQGYTEKVASLEDMRKMVESLKKEKEQVTAQKNILQKQKVQLEEKIEAQKRFVEDAKEYRLKAPIFQTSYETIKKIYEKKLTLNTVKEQIKVAMQCYEKQGIIFEKSEQEYNRVKKELFALQEMWNKGQAAILAEKLKEGDPCPVCGSIHHPIPAQKETWMPTEEEIKQKQNLVEELEKKKDKDKDRLNQAQTEKEALESRIRNSQEELGEHADIDIEKMKNDVDNKKSQWMKALEKAKKLEQENKALQKLIEEEKLVKEKLEDIEKDVQEKNETYQKEIGALKGQEEAIPENIRNIHALAEVQKQAKEHLQMLIQKFEIAKKDFDQAEKQLVSAKTAQGNAQKLLEEAIEKYNHEKNLFIQMMNKVGFEKYQDYDDAKKNEATMQKLEKEIKDFEGRWHALMDYHQRACKAAEGIVKVDVGKLEKALSDAEKEKDETLKLENSLLEKIKHDKDLLKEVERLNAVIQTQEREYEIIGNLSQVSNGDNIHGLTFQRFVLGALLDDITIAATERLKLMSKGRYHLRRTLDRARKNAAGGLELEVLDTYTGIERPVTTLSGGETFLASLSLALGLADVVQAYAGGIQLDTIFVDEGFGSLDPEALDFAMRTLIDLQKGGRLVGIISHVPELKERIDARLEVMPTENGSIAAFKIY
ncbi:SMC family ATPase [Clostridiaceae bacterium 35-E11]